MLWERKIELERETQSAMNAAQDGSDVLQARTHLLANTPMRTHARTHTHTHTTAATRFQAMKKEIHRMTLRYAQLMRRQEELMSDLEKVRAQSARTL